MKIGITRYPFTEVDRTFDQLKKFGFDTVIFEGYKAKINKE